MTMYRKSAVQNQLYPVRSAPFSAHYREEDLEALLEQNPQVLANNEPLLLISRQPNAQESGIPDLLALDADGNLVIVELKRGRPPRDVVAQALEYAAWASALDDQGLHDLANAYLARQTPPSNLTAAWQEAFGQGSAEDNETPTPLPQLNDRQRIILVLEGREERVRNVVNYLRGYGLDLNIVEYLYYRTDSGEEFLDIETVHTPQESPILQPSEAALLAEWPQEAGAAYRAYRDTLLTADDQIQVEPKKSGISFYKRTRDGRVFIGMISFSRAKMSIWYRRDSLQNYLDPDALEQEIKTSTPSHIDYRTKDKNRNDYYFTFSPNPENGRIVAQLILDHIVKKLE